MFVFVLSFCHVTAAWNQWTELNWTEHIVHDFTHSGVIFGDGAQCSLVAIGTFPEPYICISKRQGGQKRQW